MSPAEAALQAAERPTDWNPWATLAAVLLGALLIPIVDWIRARRRTERLRSTLREELVAVLGVLEDKQEIIGNSIAAVDKGGALPGYHVRFALPSYRALMEALGPDLTVKERSLLHNIFERLRVADEVVEQHEALLEMHILQKRPNPYRNIIVLLESQRDSLTMAGTLTRDYLGGKVTDVCHGDDTMAALQGTVPPKG